jgi:hypothetical protein
MRKEDYEHGGDVDGKVGQHIPDDGGGGDDNHNDV